MNNSQPIIFEYLDLSAYLQAYYNYRKQVSPRFSYEAWCDEMDFKKNRSFLRLIVIGKKKAPSSFIEAFCRLYFSSKREEEYFRYLSSYTTARTSRERQLLGNKLVQILRLQTNQVKIDNFGDFVSSPFLPRLLTFTSFKDVKATVDSSAEALGVTTDEVILGFETLQNLDLVKKCEGTDGSFFWQALSSRFKVPDDKGNLDLIKFHVQSLDEAKKAFTLPKRQRMYKSLLLTMSEEELTLLYQIIDDFAAEQITRFTPDIYQDRRVYQLNLSLYSVTGNQASKSAKLELEA